MQKKNITKLNKFAIVCIFFFAVITLIRIFNHIPWFDEAHAWTIAEQLSFFDMLDYIKNEGHFFVWQVILYPFAKLHLYPYSMQIINWLFCLSAVILMWWKAPFNNWIKALITFSFPFLGCYGVIARCYSVGILLLFALATFYECKVKYPKIYALLLIICANTSIMGLIGATAFGILFLVDIFKNKLSKKDAILTGIILSVGVILILWQILGNIYFSDIVKDAHLYTTAVMFFNTYVYHNLWLNLILDIVFAIPVLLYIYNKKSAVFFIGFTYVILLILSLKFYGFNFWHAYFYFIFLIITFWIADKKEEVSKIKNIAFIVFGLISFVLIFHSPEEKVFSGTFNSDAKIVLKSIESDDVLRKSIIIHNSGSLYELIPYIHNKSFKLKNYCQIADNTDYDLFQIFYGGCVRGNIFGQAQKYPDVIREIVGKSNNVYAFTKKDKNPLINNYGVIYADKYSIFIKKYKCFENYCFWKVEIQ